MIHYKKKKEEQSTLGETNIDKYLQTLNEMFVNYFGRGIDMKMDPNLGKFSIVQCQFCTSEKHITSTCRKLVEIRPKCAKCDRGHKTKKFGLKCSFLFWHRTYLR